MAEAWGDAPPLVTCPTACTDSELSFALRRLHSSPVRKGHESRNKQRGLVRSPSISPFPFDNHAPTLSRRDSRSSFHESAYFTSCPPSAPLTLVVRTSDRVVEVVNASTSSTSIKKAALHYDGIRSLVEEMVDTAAKVGRDTKSVEMTSGTCSLNIACSSQKSRSNPAMCKRFRRHSLAVTRNVAVQAKSMKLEQEGHAKNGAQLEWVGGVRALRDSHVRHVLRQLKHIDRLNRALDKVQHSETE